jgi:hypothetical protein
LILQSAADGFNLAVFDLPTREIMKEGYLLHKWDEKYLARHRRKIDGKVRDDRYRKARYRVPKLPKNWQAPPQPRGMGYIRLSGAAW